MPLRLLAAGGVEADCCSAAALIGGFKAGFLLAGRAYGIDGAFAKAAGIGTDAVVPSEPGCKVQRGTGLRL